MQCKSTLEETSFCSSNTQCILHIIKLHGVSMFSFMEFLNTNFVTFSGVCHDFILLFNFIMITNSRGWSKHIVNLESSICHPDFSDFTSDFKLISCINFKSQHNKS